MLKLTVVCTCVVITLRILLVLSIDQNKTKLISEDGYMVVPVQIDEKNAAHMPRNSQLEAVINILISQNSCSIHRPTEVLHNKMGLWQRSNYTHKEILVYSAFYDDRPAVGIETVVLVLGVATNSSNIYCQIWYEGLEKAYVTKAKVTENGRGDRVNKVFYGQYVFSCNLPGAHPVPTHVSLTYDKCVSSTIYTPIFLPVRSHWKEEFGICVPIAYGDIDHKDFIEWMELNSILGVGQVHVYNGTLNSTLKTLFQSYRDENLLFVHSMPPPKDVATKMGSKLGSPASINDCMLRFMYKYRYIIVVDFDEVIIPRKSRNYHDMLNDINKYHKLKYDRDVYTFRNTYFFTDFSKSSSVPLNLRTLEYQKSLPPNPHLFAPKSMVNPRKCFSMFNHYCLVQFKDYSRYFDVNTSLARSHHYKRCVKGKSCKDLEKKGSTVDKIIANNYKDELIYKVKNRLKKLGKIQSDGDLVESASSS